MIVASVATIALVSLFLKYMCLVSEIKMKCNHVYDKVEGHIGGAYAKYGQFVARHAWKILIITIIVNGALGIGFLRMESNIDVVDVYLPQGTQAREDRKRIDRIFPDLSETSFNKLQMTSEVISAAVIVKSKTGNLLSRGVLEEIKQLAERLQNLTATDDNVKTIAFTDICARTNGQCAIDGDILWDDDFLAAVDADNLTYPIFISPRIGKLNYASFLGEIVQMDNSGRYLTGMEYIKLEFWFQNAFKKDAIVWNKEFVSTCDSFNSDTIQIAYGHFNSLSEGIDAMLLSDITLFTVTFTLMIAYACVATISARITDQVGQRMLLGIAGVFAAGLAVIASFGLCAACGVTFVSIVGLMPFLIIGIGIDDMFIMLSGLCESQSKQSVEDKIGETMRIAGVGITITSLTDLIAFLVGAASNFVAVRNFCIYTGVAVIFCFVNNITFFAACMTLNERRVADNRHFMTCRRIKTKQEVASEENRSKCHVICCSGKPPVNRNEAESLFDKLPRWLIPKIVLNLPCKIIIVFLFLGYLAGAIYGCINMKQGLSFSQLVNDDSYFYTYSEWFDNYFTEQVPITFVIPKTYDYSKSDTQDLVTNLIAAAKSNEYIDDNFEVNWLKAYRSSIYYTSKSESEFINGLLNFLDDRNYAIFKNDVIINNVTKTITSSRIYVLSKDMKGSQESGEVMLQSREIADQAEIECFAFGALFVAYEQYVRILGQTLQSVGIALVAVFVVTCVFMPHPLLVFLCLIAVTMIMVGVFGYVYYVDIALSAITMIHVIMSIGFSVDFTAHICHGYMLSRAKTRNDRVHEAIDKTGAPIFHGALSSSLGIIVLAGAASYAFRTFSVVMLFVLLFGIAHALLLLPVVLSWIGPESVLHVQDTSDCLDSAPSSKSNKQDSSSSRSIIYSKPIHHHSKTRQQDRNKYESNIYYLSDMAGFKQNARQYKINRNKGLDDQWVWTEVQK